MALLFFIGSAVGSFLNVLIDRIPRDESIFLSRSYCEKCKKRLAWYDLIPLFSFLLLRGRCRYCKHAIPSRLFLVEMLNAIGYVAIFFLTYSTLPLSVILILCAIFSTLIVLFFIDYYHSIIPDILLIVLLVLGTVYHLLIHPIKIPTYIIVGLISFLFLYIPYKITSGKGMGYGDVQFAFVIGFLLGFPQIIVAFYGAFLTGALLSIILIIAKKKKLRGDTIPFGPFLIIGILCSLFLTDWAMQFFTF